jgi:hypothetical protein
MRRLRESWNRGGGGDTSRTWPFIAVVGIYRARAIASSTTAPFLFVYGRAGRVLGSQFRLHA